MSNGEIEEIKPTGCIVARDSHAVGAPICHVLTPLLAVKADIGISPTPSLRNA